MQIKIKALRQSFLLLFLIFLPFTSFPIEISNLFCEFQQNPLAVNTLQPRFGWQITNAENGTAQSAYEIEVTGENLNWNSGKVISDISQFMKYTGETLKPGQKYQWRVRIWDEKGVISQWSSYSNFRIAPNFNFL